MADLFKDVEKTDSSTEKKKPSYISKDGFVKVKVIRGFSEIKNLCYDLGQFKCFICGGYVRYMASPQFTPVPASDVDIYCESEEVAEEVKKFMEKQGLTVRHENNISITYQNITDHDHKWFGTPTVQLVKPMEEGKVVSVGNMEKILENFDFTVIRAGLLSENGALVDADFLHDEKAKTLRLKNIHCPISSMLRCMKYSKKGYWLPPTQSLKLLLDWDNRDDGYRTKIVEYLEKANEGEGLTQEEIDELEKLMRID